MRKYVFLVMVALLAAPGVALSQSGGGMMNPNRPNGGQGGNSAQFQTHKAEILQRISKRMTELQQRQSCVQAATDRQALMACMPQKTGQQGQR